MNSPSDKPENDLGDEVIASLKAVKVAMQDLLPKESPEIEYKHCDFSNVSQGNVFVGSRTQ